MPKTPKPGPAYSQDREWAVILEDLRAQFLTFGEGLEYVRKDLTAVKEKVGHLVEDVTTIKLIIPTLATKKDLAAVKNDLAGVKDDLAVVKNDLAAVKEKVGHLAEDVTTIKLTIPTLATKKDIEDVRKDIRDLGKRMILIESAH